LLTNKHHEDQRLFWLAQADERRGEMLREIVRLHQELASGVDAYDLPKLKRAMQDFTKTYKNFNPGSLDDRARAAAARIVLSKTSSLAWDELLALLKDKPSAGWHKIEVGPGHEQQDAERLMNYMISEQKDLFIGSNIDSFTDLITGDVAAWKYDYPDPKSSLGRQVALRAVASGIKARLIDTAVKKIQAGREEIWGTIRNLMDQEYQTINEQASRGVSSLDEAHEILAAVNAALDAVSANVVWKYVESELFKILKHKQA
jgi:hypothetical protein